MSGQSISNGNFIVCAGSNAYTFGLSADYNDSWKLNLGYQTNEFHFNQAEDLANDSDPFADRFFLTAQKPLMQKEKISHLIGVGAMLSGTSAQNTIPFLGSLHYTLEYLLNDKIKGSLNFYGVNSESNDISVGLTVNLF
jgi:hypothetical protein